MPNKSGDPEPPPAPAPRASAAPVEAPAPTEAAPKSFRLDLGGSVLGNGAFITIKEDAAVIWVNSIDTANDLVQILRAARQAGATKGALFTGHITSPTDLIRYQRFAATGGSRFGGTVTQLTEDTFRLDFDEFPDFTDSEADSCR